MTDYTAPDVNELLPGDPVTSIKMLYLALNPIAIAEQAVGAPKIADKSLVGSGSTVTFSGLDDYAGIFIRGSDSGGAQASIAFRKDNGGSFSANVAITAPGGFEAYHPYLEVFLDFATGNYRAASSSVRSGVLSVDSRTGTIAGASLAITDVRISSGFGNVALFAVPQGGDSAS